jgi:diaminohydroxyphosphoribosylaminopyrimidine deaminase/5-amino-6-(5-phosphoribosylamino)uracil reductase
MVSDAAGMRRALFHAARAVGGTVPNPVVGAVVVSDDGVVAGQGYHERAGLAHAEVVALDAAGGRARGATMYVTLEPCCHVGRTGPCTRRVIDAGIRRVVAATLDPDARVAGRGVEELRAAGIEVHVGLGAADARCGGGRGSRTHRAPLGEQSRAGQ